MCGIYQNLLQCTLAKSKIKPKEFKKLEGMDEDEIRLVKCSQLFRLYDQRAMKLLSICLHFKFCVRPLSNSACCLLNLFSLLIILSLSLDSPTQLPLKSPLIPFFLPCFNLLSDQSAPCLHTLGQNSPCLSISGSFTRFSQFLH